MRNIPENNLAYPMLITWHNGATGSGFALCHENTIYFVTAKHCLYNNSNLISNKLTLLCQTHDINDDSCSILEVSIKDIEIRSGIFAHPTHDVAGFVLGYLENVPDKGLKGTYVDGVIKKSEANCPLVLVNPKDAVAFLKEVLISNDVFIYGYPVSLGLKQSPQFEYNKPLLRKGIVANVNKKQGTIILDAPVYYGNSGGPVVQVFSVGGKTLHKVIGIVSQFIPYTESWVNQSNGIVHNEISNSGYSVAVPMDYVFEMLKISGTS